MSKTASVQQLLAAEKRAAELVDAAKKNRAAKLKQAKIDAEAEITAFRQKRQALFDAFQNEQMLTGDEGSRGAVQKADSDIATLKQRAGSRRDKVSDILVKLVLAVD
eukprot:NODE_4518_length_797_cov_34.034759_g4178_i0.p1 GENE.NODE_4518_length_797_cov_34.034759_g4178_i0~~NODE_4518_length_797_cov_34.034759_g4178_i0.p1  ORF type:complete len:107 (+),score=31.51 NODE_4518_length_797_cov_34.034759_g4178_i0:88-408(+)